VFRLLPTPHDPIGAFLQVEGSPFDSVRRRSIYRIRMACKRSGVRIPLAPQVRAVIRYLSLRILELYSSKVQQRRRISSRTSVRIRSPHGVSRRLALLRHETDRPCGQPKRHDLLERGVKRSA